MSENDAAERPRLLFIQPSGWVPPVFDDSSGRKKKVREGYRDHARAEERKEEWYHAFFGAGWLAEHYTDKDDLVALARKRAPAIVIVPGHFWKDGATMRGLRELDPPPVLLVAVNDWDSNVAGLVAYTGAANWFPYWYRNNVAAAAASWRKGPPSAEEQVILDGTLPLQKPVAKKRASRKKSLPKDPKA